MVGLVSGLAYGLVGGDRDAPGYTDFGLRNPAMVLGANLVFRLVVLLVGGLVFGLGFEQWYGLRLGPGFGLVDGLVFGLVIGALVGLPMSGTCWPRFAVASLWLWVRRRLPLRLMGFLDDAYRLGLLRIVGPVYQFRHAALQDHLAPPAKSITTAAGPSTSAHR